MFVFQSSPNHIPIKYTGSNEENQPLKTHTPYTWTERHDHEILRVNIDYTKEVHYSIIIGAWSIMIGYEMGP